MSNHNLYRGKPLTGGEWVKGFHFQAMNDIGCETRIADYIIEPHIFVLQAEGMISQNRLAILDFIEVIPESVGQSTGRKASGEPVFVNDIVRTPGGQVLVVSCHDLIEGDPKFGAIRIEDCKVIGNLTENRELLEQSHD